MVAKTFVPKMNQAKARIWPWLVYLFHVRSTAERRRTPTCEDRVLDGPASEKGSKGMNWFNCIRGKGVRTTGRHPSLQQRCFKSSPLHKKSSLAEVCQARVFQMLTAGDFATKVDNG